MQTYIVRRRVDAYVDYVAEVVADDAKQAAAIAASMDDDLDWANEGAHEFDERIFITLNSDGDELTDTEFRR